MFRPNGFEGNPVSPLEEEISDELVEELFEGSPDEQEQAPEEEYVDVDGFLVPKNTKEFQKGSRLTDPAYRRPQVKRFRGTPEQMREKAKDVMDLVDNRGEEYRARHAERGAFGEEREFSLGSLESISSIQSFAEDRVSDRLAEAGLDTGQLKETDMFTEFLELAQVMRGIREKISRDVELTNEDGEAVERAFAAVDTAAVELPGDSESGSEAFDPEAYIFAYIDRNSVFTHRERASVNSLRREYARAVDEEDFFEAAGLADEIKDLVDELVTQKGLPKPLEPGETEPVVLATHEKRKKLELESLDDEDDSVEIAKPDTMILTQEQLVLDEDLVVEENETSETVVPEVMILTQEQLVSDEEPVPAVSEEMEPLPAEEVVLEEPVAQAEVDLEPETLPVEPAETPAPVSFTPESVSKPELSDRDKDKFLKQAVTGFEKLKPSFFDRIANDLPSPYEKLGNESYEDLVWSTANTPSEKLTNWLNDSVIDIGAFENWMQLAPEIQEAGIETAGRTFKEVADDFLLLELTNQTR